MKEEAKSIDEVMEAASGPHFSGLRIDGLLSSPSASPRAAAAAAAAAAAVSASYFAQSDSGSSIRQPFVIGEFGSSIRLALDEAYLLLLERSTAARPSQDGESDSLKWNNVSSLLERQVRNLSTEQFCRNYVDETLKKSFARESESTCSTLDSWAFTA